MHHSFYQRRLAQVAEMRADGMSTQAIGRAIGRTTERVRQMLCIYNEQLTRQVWHDEVRDLAAAGRQAELLMTPLDALCFRVNIDTRIHDTLHSMGLHTLGDLVACSATDLSHRYRIGTAALAELERTLHELGLKLAPYRWKG